MVREYSITFIIIDALDECQARDGERKKFLAELFNLQAPTATNLLVTSRFIPEIEKEFNAKSTKQSQLQDWVTPSSQTLHNTVHPFRQPRQHPRPNNLLSRPTDFQRVVRRITRERRQDWQALR